MHFKVDGHVDITYATYASRFYLRFTDNMLIDLSRGGPSSEHRHGVQV
jgi:hypothetical protein